MSAITNGFADGGQINGKVKILLGEGKAEDVKAGVEEDPEADVAIACPLCGAMFDLRTGESALLVVTYVLFFFPLEELRMHR